MNEQPTLNAHNKDEFPTAGTNTPEKSRPHWLAWSLGLAGLLWLLALAISSACVGDISLLIFVICMLLGIFFLGFFVLGFVFSWMHKEIQWKVLRWSDIFGLLLWVLTLIPWNSNPKEFKLLNDMAQNYEEHQSKMESLVNYARNACDTNCFITIEWKWTGEIDRFHVQVDGHPDYNWDVSNDKRDSLIALAGLTKEELKIIRKKMKDCNCIWLETSNCGENPYSNLGFKRVGMGAYSYYIFDTVPSDSIQNNLAKAPSCIRYNERVFFEYGGGAFGPDSFSPAIKQKFLEQHKP